MSLAIADKLTRAVMYEGYLLYPYTPSAIKNRQRWTFGALYPRRYTDSRPGADADRLQCECLVYGNEETEVLVRIRFLHLVSVIREGGATAGRGAHTLIPELPELGCAPPSPGPPPHEWEEAVECEEILPAVRLGALTGSPITIDFGSSTSDESPSGTGRVRYPLQGQAEASCEKLSDSLYRLCLKVINTSEHAPATRTEALLRSMVATHLVLSTCNGKFLSMIDPPADCKQHAENCRNSGTWPVLLGQPGDASHLLAAPIILYDYPQIAPESPGDLFDGGEIDEILSLRILTLTDDEKQQIRSGDPVGKAMLERTERLSEQDMLQLHGTWRTTGGERSSPGLQPGTRVRIQPKKCNDAFDLILSGMTATVEKIEEDLDGGFHAVVALDDDPGRDLDAKAQLGHRFFYRPEDLQPL